MDKPEKEEDVTKIQAEEAPAMVPAVGAGDLTIMQAPPEDLERSKANVILTTGPYGTFRFHLNQGEEMLRIERNGDVFVRGNKVDTDLEVYNGLRAWLCLAEKVNPDGTQERLVQQG